MQYGIRLSESKTQAAHCAASGTVCERKVLPVSTDSKYFDRPTWLRLWYTSESILDQLSIQGIQHHDTSCLDLSVSSYETFCCHHHFQLKIKAHHDKTAELLQRRPRDAPNIWVTWVPWKVLRALTTHPATFPEICNGFLFRSILRMCVQDLKFVVLPVSEITGGTEKIWAVPDTPTLHFPSKF